MRQMSAGLAVLCLLTSSLLGLTQQPSVGGLAVEEAAPAAWEFFLGTWLHVDEFGAGHTFTFRKQGVYGVEVWWEKSDSLLGVVSVASAEEIIFFDSEAGEDRYGIVSWEDPIEAYGIFYNGEEVDDAGNDQIRLTVYRYVTQGGIESSRDNFRLTMVLTRQPDDS